MLEHYVSDTLDKANFGVPGLDDITVGGLTRGRLFLLEGSPGTGKTTMSTQFLMAGAAAGEPTLYITLSETEDELRAGAKSHGWSPAGEPTRRRSAAKPALFVGP
jgi:circadian clock protein KaiC